jgi:hypothetical protein
MKITIAMLVAMLLVPCQSEAWIAYGFRSGMSRFEVSKYLAAREFPVVTESAQQTFAGAGDSATKYNMVYCSTPQKLYLMKYWLDDSPEVFVQTLEKYEKRYGKPEGLEDLAGYLNSRNWQDTDFSLIWDLRESETILLTHDLDGTRTEFQDISVCK